MGSITTGIGLISGIDTASLIDSLINLESRGKFRIEDRIASLRAQQTALLDINARLLNFSNAIKTMRSDSIFRSALATSSDELILTATAGKGTLPGTYKFIINSLVNNSQKLSQGFTSTNSTPLGLGQAPETVQRQSVHSRCRKRMGALENTRRDAETCRRVTGTVELEITRALT